MEHLKTFQKLKPLQGKKGPTARLAREVLTHAPSGDPAIDPNNFAHTLLGINMGVDGINRHLDCRAYPSYRPVQPLAGPMISPNTASSRPRKRKPVT